MILVWWSPATATTRETASVTSFVVVASAATLTGSALEPVPGLADDELVLAGGHVVEPVAAVGARLGREQRVLERHARRPRAARRPRP